MEKIEYIIVGDNNFWYCKTQALTKEELKSELDKLKKDIQNSEYPDQPFNPSKLFAYPIDSTKMISNDLDGLIYC